MGVILLLLFLSFSLTSRPSESHNITEILSTLPEYTSFNSYLIQTNLADEINNRQPVTVLVLTNAALSTLVSKHSLSVVKTALSIHVLLDYFDAEKLHNIGDGTVLSTTLYQTTGQADGQTGFVNITDLLGGKVGFGSGVPGSALDSTYTKEVKQVPYSLSVIEISQPIIVPGVLMAPAPSASEVNITALLVKAGCKTFASMLGSTGVINVIQTAASTGLTMFAPSDEAYKAVGLPDLTKLTNAELVSLLQYHALSTYSPIGILKSAKDPMNTLATGRAGKYQLGATAVGDEVTLKAGLDSSRVASTVIDTTPLCIFTIDSVLLPAELFGKGPSPAPESSQEPVTAAPSTARSDALAPTFEVAAPAPLPSRLSPQTPPTESPKTSLVDAPSKAADSAPDSASSIDVKAPALLKALIVVAVSVILQLL